MFPFLSCLSYSSLLLVAHFHSLSLSLSLSLLPSSFKEKGRKKGRKEEGKEGRTEERKERKKKGRGNTLEVFLISETTFNNKWQKKSVSETPWFPGANAQEISTNSELPQ